MVAMSNDGAPAHAALTGVAGVDVVAMPVPSLFVLMPQRFHRAACQHIGERPYSLSGFALKIVCFQALKALR